MRVSFNRPQTYLLVLTLAPIPPVVSVECFNRPQTYLLVLTFEHRVPVDRRRHVSIVLRRISWYSPVMAGICENPNFMFQSSSDVSLGTHKEASKGDNLVKIVSIVLRRISWYSQGVRSFPQAWS